MISPWDRGLVALGGSSGLCGVALAAAAAHVTGGGSVATAANFLLFHAPALLVLPALIAGGLLGPRLGRSAGYVMAVGVILFAGDLAVRGLFTIVPVPMAAPTGGVILMASWALIVLAACLPPKGAWPVG